jgi:1-acyl-sn-glycerol-3-phosphate acyltransferase
VAGSHHLWLGPIPKPRRVRAAFGEPIEASELGDSPAALTELIDGRVWPAVSEEYGRLRAAPGLIAAGLTAVGMGAVVARRQRARPRPRLLGMVETKKLRRRKARSRLGRRMRAAVRRRG